MAATESTLMGRIGQEGAALLVAILLAPAPAAAARPQPQPAGREPISAGNVDSPFATAIDQEGRLHLVYTRILDGGARRLDYRAELAPGSWGEPEPVLEPAPDSVQIAIAAFGPVIGFHRAGEAAIALRDPDGWYGHSLASPALHSSSIALSSEDPVLRVLVPIDPGAGDGSAPAVRRVVLAAARVIELRDYPLPDVRGGRIAGLEAALAGSGWDHLLLQRVLPAGRMLRIGGDGKSDADFRSLTLTRLRELYPPAIILPVRGRLLDTAFASIEARPAALWTERVGEQVQLTFQAMRPGAERGETLLPAAEELIDFALAARDQRLLVALLLGRAPRTRILARWNEAGVWSEWEAPPGADQLGPVDPVAIEAVIDASGRARTVVLERWQMTEGGARLVEWEVLPGRVIVLGR